MAEKEEKVEKNVPGKFYVDENCIACNDCNNEVEEYFKADEDEGYSYVFKQPTDDEGIQACKDAMEACPVESIGEDG